MAVVVKYIHAFVVVKRVAELADGATVLTENALSLRGSNVSGSEQEVKEWVKDIGK